MADRKRTPRAAVLDTNVFIAGGFNDDSAAAAILQHVRDGALVLVWHEATKAETRKVLKQIPPLSWGHDADLFRAEGRYDGDLDEEAFSEVEDPTDRKFAALAAATGTPLVTNDDDLLDAGRTLPVSVLRTKEFAERF